MTNDTDFQNFIKNFPSVNTVPASDELIERYINVVPENLLKFWKDYGFGTYGNGFIQIINPDIYRDTLKMWLLREDDGQRIPIAMSAFGDLFYWRHIYNPNPTEDFPEWVFDVSYFDPHTSETGLCTYTMGEFFGDYLMQEFAQQIFKRQFHSGFVVGMMEDDLTGELDREKTSLFDRSLKKLGKLEPNEMYFFVPALRLGGIDDVEYVEKGDALVQLDILFQIATDGESNYHDDSFDFYEETDKLDGIPANFDRRIEELKNEMNSENEAHNNYMIGKLLDEYPVYHESIQNSDLVAQRTKTDAFFYHQKAKELDPENAKYYYASFRSRMSDFDNKNWEIPSEDIQKYYDLTGDEEQYLQGKLEIAQAKVDTNETVNLCEKLFDLTQQYSYLNSAATDLEQNDIQKAEEIYNRVLEETDQFSDAGTATYRLSEILLNQNQSASVNALYDKLLQRFPENEAEVYYQQGLFYKNDFQNKNHLDNALPYLKKAAETAENQDLNNYSAANYWQAISKVYEDKNEFDKALNALDKAFELTGDTYYKDEKAALLYKIGKEDEAKDTFSNCQYSNTDFNKKFDDNNWEDVLYSLGNSVSGFDSKIERLKTDLSANNQDAQKQFLLAKLYDEYPVYELPAEEQEAKNKFLAENAFKAYSEALKIDSQNPVYHLNLSNFLYHSHHNLELDEEKRNNLMKNGYQFYVDNSENPYKGYEGMMWIAAYYDDFANVAKYAKLAYDTDPNEIYNLITLGNANRELGRFPEAMNAYNEYLQTNTDSYDVKFAKQGLAETYISMGEKERAEKLIEEMANSENDDEEKAEAYHTGSEAFRMRSDFLSAIKFQEKAVYFAEKSGSQDQINKQLFDLASAYEDNTNYKEAISVMQKLTASRGDSFDFTYLGRLLKDNGQEAEAKIAYNKALQIDPEDDYTKSLLAELNEKKKGGFFGKWF